MDIADDDQDDFYAPEEPMTAAAAPAPAAPEIQPDEDLEEGEQEDEEEEMDEDDSVRAIKNTESFQNTRLTFGFRISTS